MIPRHSETNAIAERANRTIFTMSRTAILAAGMQKSLWDKATAWAAYMKNQLHHKSLPNQKIPAEILLDRNPINARSNLQPFRQKVNCFDYEIKHKLSARSWKGGIVRYTLTHGVYQVITNSGSFKLVKDPTPIQTNELEEEAGREETDLGSEAMETMLEEALQVNPEEIRIIESLQKEPPPALRKKKRTAAEWEENVASRFSTRDRRTTEKSKISAVSADPDHPTDEQARNSPYAKEWAKARQKERAQLVKYRVFMKIKKLPEGVKPVDTKWVYVIKRGPNGEIETYEARKVGRGFTQIEGINYDETYAQMMRPKTRKMLLIIALYRGWEIRQWDVVAAYLQANLHHDIYISDTNEEGEIEYWKLHKALYGLKQAGHEWYKTLERILEIAGLKQCIGDEGAYASRRGNILIGTHVDDLIGIAPQGATLDEIEKSIQASVELEKRGKPGKILGMELTSKQDSVILTQKLLTETMTKTHLPL